MDAEGWSSLPFMRFEDAILHTRSHVGQADGLGLFFEPDQWLAIEPHFDATAQAGAEGGLEGESLFGGVIVGPRLVKPELDLERSDGDGVRTVADVRSIGFHL